MQIIRHLDLRLPFRLHNPSTLPVADKTSTSSSSPVDVNIPRAITPEPDSAMAPPSPHEEFKSELEKPLWQEYMETSLSERILKPNRIERGILRIIHKMLSSPPDDQHAAQRATQEVRDFWAYLYKKYVTRDELVKAGGERLQKLGMEAVDSPEGEGVDYRGAGYFLEHAAGFVLEMAPTIGMGDVNHGRIFRFLEGFRDGAGEKNVAVRFFDHKNPKFIYDPYAIGRAATVVWKYTCPSVRSGINSSRVECDGRSAFSALLARLLSADLLPLQKAALLVHDIDLALCPDFFTDLQAQAQTQNDISPSSSSSSSSSPLRGLHIRLPAEIPTYIVRCRELIAARNILIASQHLGSYGLTYADQEVGLMVTQLDGTVLKINTNIPDWKWTMWLYAFGKISADAQERADKALGVDFGGVNESDHKGEDDSDTVWEGLGSFDGVTGGGTGDNDTSDTDEVPEEEDDDDCDKGIFGQQRNIELGICAQKACLRLQNWVGVMESLKEQEQEQVVLIEESEETFEVTVPVQKEQQQQQQQDFVPLSESGSDDSDDMQVGRGVTVAAQDEDEDQDPEYITLTMEDVDFWSNLSWF